MDLAAVVEAIHAHRLRITDHADEEAHADQLSLDEILFSVTQGEVLESYPTDKPFPSCLIGGTTRQGDPVHSVWAYNAESRWAVLVTVYRPDPERWVDWRKRRPR
jgi:uncharacterized protein DUF4258